MEGESLLFQHIIDNPLNVQGNDGPAAFVGLQKEAVVGIVVEEILRQGCTTEGILQDVEVAFPVGITVRVVLPELVSGEPERCGTVEAIGQLLPPAASFSALPLMSRSSLPAHRLRRRLVVL